MPLIAKEHIIIIFISRRLHAWIWIWRCLGGGGYFAARPGNSSKADAISVFVGAKVKLLFSCFRWGVTYFTGTKPLSWPRVWHPIRFLTFQENTPSSWSSREIYYDLWETFRQCSRRGSQTFPWIQCPHKEVPLNVTLWNAIAAFISKMKPVLGRLCSRHINFCPWWSFVVVTFSKGTHTVQVALFLAPRIPPPQVNLVLHDQLNFFSMVSISILTVSV